MKFIALHCFLLCISLVGSLCLFSRGGSVSVFKSYDTIITIDLFVFHPRNDLVWCFELLLDSPMS